MQQYANRLNDFSEDNQKEFDYYKREIENQLQQYEINVRQESQRVQKHLSESRKADKEFKESLYESKLEFIRNWNEKSKYSVRSSPRLEESIKLLEELLKKDNVFDVISSKSLIADIIDELVRIYYYSRKVREAEALVSQYSEKVNLAAHTYFNLGLIHFDNYLYDLSEPQKNLAIKYLDKSLEVFSDYGYPLALKVILNMITNYSENNQDFNRSEIDKILDVIEFSKDSYKEFVKRLSDDSKNSLAKKYIDKFYEMFGDRSTKIEEKIGATEAPVSV